MFPAESAGAAPCGANMFPVGTDGAAACGAKMLLDELEEDEEGPTGFHAAAAAAAAASCSRRTRSRSLSRFLTTGLH